MGAEYEDLFIRNLVHEFRPKSHLRGWPVPTKRRTVGSLGEPVATAIQEVKPLCLEHNEVSLSSVLVVVFRQWFFHSLLEDTVLCAAKLGVLGESLGEVVALSPSSLLEAGDIRCDILEHCKSAVLSVFPLVPFGLTFRLEDIKGHDPDLREIFRCTFAWDC